MLRSTLPLLALVALASTQQLPAGAPACAATCLQAKLREAGTLVPGVDATNVAALCSSSTFTGAFDQCLQDNCNTADIATSQALLAQVCAGSTTAASVTESAASTVAGLESSASSVLATASSDAASVISSAATVTSAGALESASASVDSSLESLSASLGSDVSSRAASITSSAASAASSALNVTSVSSGASASASGTTGAGSSGNSAATASFEYSTMLVFAASVVGCAALL
ncbi:hypothetical protein JCM3775_000566 [Rhodotorula graminis]|uniref:CFEM domain-containing protein n=1 Tax=Rhodotorula graminis (strain WP1) TaxID=578459 RepID=A0A0P9F278_RHOGW|nr:uncharacterized protein RHOBADRAFT_54421 [Rhodotorula graminis WP1]KPV73825.1 hypothetical protein RHOBADRAFT_54421 [Rhodotorula graminis WP1]